MASIRDDEHLRRMKEPVIKEGLRFGIDIDGTITQAPRHFKRLIDALMKSGNRVFIVTARDETRRESTKDFLSGLGILYDELIMKPADWSDTVSSYKVKVVQERDLHMMFDDDEANCWAIELFTQALAAHMLPIPELSAEMMSMLDDDF